MGTVFPSSREERCPRDDCRSPQVEPLRQAEFASLGRESSPGALWLCMMCQRPFKLVRESEAAVQGRRDPAIPLERGAETTPLT
jgi:hypothetical protein